MAAESGERVRNDDSWLGPLLGLLVIATGIYLFASHELSRAHARSECEAKNGVYVYQRGGPDTCLRKDALVSQ